LLPALVIPFLFMVAISVVGVVALSFLFVMLATWAHRHFPALPKDLASKNHP